MATVTILNNDGSRRTIEVEFSSTCFEENAKGQEFFELIFQKVGIKFTHGEYLKFKYDVNNFYHEYMDDLE